MSSEQDYKKSFAHLINEELNAIASSEESAGDYAKSQDLDYAQIKSDGLRKFKQLRLKLRAQVKKEEDKSKSHLLQIALDKVKNLMKTPDFSFVNFLNDNQIALHNRKIESFDENDIRETLQKFIYLQLVEEEKAKDNAN